MNRQIDSRVAICLLLILASLAAICLSVGIQEGFGSTPAYVAGALLVASVLSFAFCLNESKEATLKISRIKFVSLRAPLSVKKENVIMLSDAQSVLAVAKKRNREVLVHEGEHISGCYVISDGFTFAFEKEKTEQIFSRGIQEEAGDSAQFST
ncbi:MAG: hypothetical protein FWG10_02865 [Eubacteriaceae bacterium]|nr:hypothetical protein [Eubacteriaceae bacterium]